MNEFEKELQYVKKVYQDVRTPFDLQHAKDLRNQFLNKYITKISGTDKTFLRIQNDLTRIDQEITIKISSGYLFN